ncbi:hypothetical protein HUJ05_012597 [Dendroctonus ponderosae]|nr:hypothetical protein HUJ05_012597 [Dendroctonus ponderosae]
MARAAGSNKTRIDDFYKLLKRICEADKITATRIFNVEETGCSTVQRRCQKILAKKGKHQIGSISSGEKGINTTVVCCASAAGQFVPPMVIFKRKLFQKELSIGAPPGSIATISDTGYINSELFIRWLNHFIETVKPSPEARLKDFSEPFKTSMGNALKNDCGIMWVVLYQCFKIPG